MSKKKRHKLKPKMFFAQRGLCHWCGYPMVDNAPSDPNFATFEHLKRRREGGTNAEGILKLAHSRCNHQRG